MNSSNDLLGRSESGSQSLGCETKRLLSLDALRGFDMMWIVGAGAFLTALEKMTPSPITKTLATQLTHVDWEGFRFYDLIFPLFVFIAGVSSVWSLCKERALHGFSGAAWRVVRRGFLLIIFGIVYSGGLSTEWPNIRVLGVLQRIGLAYMGAGLIFLSFELRTRIVIWVAILLGYWVIMSWVPIRDVTLDSTLFAKQASQEGRPDLARLFGEGNPSAVSRGEAWSAANTYYYSSTNWIRGSFEKGRNLANHMDFLYLPGKRYDNYYDPEGLLSTLPAIATCLLGTFAGVLLRSGRYSEKQKVNLLFIGSVLLIASGLGASVPFPIIKKLWTSSYVLVAGGCSTLLLALFYWMVEIQGWNRWCMPFVWVGTNSITIYMANNIIGFRRLAERFVGGEVRLRLDSMVGSGAGDLLLALVSLGIGVLMCWYLHKKRIFLRL